MNIIKKCSLLFLFIILTGCVNNSENFKGFKADIIYTNIVESTVLIIKEEIQQGDSVTSISYTSGFSGVIVQKSTSKYYILTAYHPIENLTTENLYVLLWNEPRYNELPIEERKGANLYYQSKPKGTIEYVDVLFDLAIISFESNVDLRPLEVSASTPKYNDQVAVISNPVNRDRNYLSFGIITTKTPVPFGDDKDHVQHPVIEHTAYINEGSSGSVLLNEELKIVGINLGGSTNFFGHFRRAKAMPSDRIIEFLNDFNEKSTN